VPIDPSELGRIAAQSARQIVMQRLRDAERTKILSEFKDKVGIMVTGIVQRFERRDVILNIGKTEGLLPANEIPAGAHYKFNDRLRVLILRVEDTPRGPSIVLSRKNAAIGRRAVPPGSARDRRRHGCRSSASPARPACAPRSPSSPSTRTWTRWALASA